MHLLLAFDEEHACVPQTTSPGRFCDSQVQGVTNDDEVRDFWNLEVLEPQTSYGQGSGVASKQARCCVSGVHKKKASPSPSRSTEKSESKNTTA